MLLVNVSIQDMYRPAEQVPLRGIGSVLREKETRILYPNVNSRRLKIDTRTPDFIYTISPKLNMYYCTSLNNPSILVLLCVSCLYAGSKENRQIKNKNNAV